MIKGFLPLFYQTFNSSAIYKLNEETKTNSDIDFPLVQDSQSPVKLTSNVYSSNLVFLPNPQFNPQFKSQDMPSLPKKVPLSGYEIEIKSELLDLLPLRHRKLIDII